MLKQLDSICKKKKKNHLDRDLITFTKINAKWIMSKCKMKNYKIFQKIA